MVRRVAGISRRWAAFVAVVVVLGVGVGYLLMRSPQRGQVSARTDQSRSTRQEGPTVAPSAPPTPVGGNSGSQQGTTSTGGSHDDGATSAGGCSPYPFNPLPTAQLRASAKKAFAFYFPPFPLSIDNKDAGSDFYFRWLNRLDKEGYSKVLF